MNRISGIMLLNNTLACISVILLIIYLTKKNRHLAIFFFCAAVNLILFAHVLIKLPRTSPMGWILWIIIWVLLTFGVINLIKGLKSKKT